METSLLINEIINKYFKEDFYKASLVADNLKQIMEEAKERYKLKEIYLTPVLGDIVKKGFLKHFSSPPKTSKALGNALWKFSNGKISKEELYKTAKHSISGSLSTNTRNAYQCWVLLALLNLIECKLIDWCYKKYLNELPEKSRNISLKSKRGNKAIFPNFIMEVSGKFFSVFYEGPGAVGWGRKEYEKIFTLLIKEYGYNSPRPDIMIYSGKVDNIYDVNEKPFPIRKNPFMSIECKEKADWYKNKKKGKKEIDIVKEYKEIYSPKNYFVVSLEETPEDICKELETLDIICINNVGFDKNKLIKIASQLLA
ncbi:MAG: hypothetical protein FE041_00940 [Thermoplasmata archaeon]|nr:MAG: hypothetical protein FE041_00940 [Thermoplasmata archaeon]